jgi:AAHS family 4-hydroxybenzoate transporter-like MFS transporter
VDVSAILDTARFGAVQLTVLAFTFVALVMDGFDIQAIAFAAPALMEDWGIARSSLGPVLAASLLGMVVGAAGIGSLGDRRGRKTALIVSCAMMALGSVASALANGPNELATYRFITGVGLGGALPNATALMFEFAPKSWRQIATAVALIGVPLGGMLGAALARWLIPEHGWRALFVVGGVIPALLAGVMWPLVPESPRFLARLRTRGAELSKLLNRIVGSMRYDARGRFIGGGPAATAASAVGAIFTAMYRRDTITLWLIFFTNVFSVYFFFNWLPTVLASAKLDYTLAVTASLYFNLGGVVGALAGSALTGRYGSRRVLAGLSGLAVLSAIGIGANGVFDAGQTGGSISALMWTIAVAGGCINGLQIGMFAVAAYVYPTFCRSTGIGWSLAVARFGGIISSFVGASFFALGLMARDFFYVIGAVLSVAFLGVLLLRGHIPAARGEAS